MRRLVVREEPSRMRVRHEQKITDPQQTLLARAIQALSGQSVYRLTVMLSPSSREGVQKTGSKHWMNIGAAARSKCRMVTCLNCPERGISEIVLRPSSQET